MLEFICYAEVICNNHDAIFGYDKDEQPHVVPWEHLHPHRSESRADGGNMTQCIEMLRTSGWLIDHTPEHGYRVLCPSCNDGEADPKPLTREQLQQRHGEAFATGYRYGQARLNRHDLLEDGPEEVL